MAADISMIEPTVRSLREYFASGATKPRIWRQEQLEALRALVAENTRELLGALYADLHKSATEAQMTEIGITLDAIDHSLKNLARWTAPRRLPLPLTLAPGKAATVREPLGTVLIIAPWNYPVQLLLVPLVGALAAGNTVVLKPSEVTPTVSSLIARLVPNYLDSQAVRVIEGGVEETTQVLAQRYDHIFYTGNGQVGRVVARAAAEHLTPITLELGGKSPTLVEPGIDLVTAARRIVWAKFINAGQTCVAPDYLLAIDGVEKDLVPELQAAITEMFGQNPQQSPDYGRMVNDRHFQRVSGYLDDGEILQGGRIDAAEKYIEPTLLKPASLKAPVMTQEIFGPLLPIVTVASLDEAIDFINERDKPLALYGFVQPQNQQRLVAETSSGGLVFGAGLVHLSPHNWQFGGVGESGMGAYHGEKSVEIFSHEKTVFIKPLTPDTLRLIYPPYTGLKGKLLGRII
ncbi:aldehyde dehydrogenase family protein [Rothia sp. P5766]|uniref:aldehyde dehydrogenase family protein n=1 Tax=Rothia sp. P5766 TaxID=3402656 RepID=UPI003ADD01D6